MTRKRNQWWSSLYESDAELMTEIQNFKEEREQVRKGKEKWKNYARYFMLLILSENIVASMIFRGFFGGILAHCVTVTGIGVVETMIFVYLSIVNWQDTGRSKSRTLHAIHHMAFEFCLPTNLAIVLVYWPVLHADAME